MNLKNNKISNYQEAGLRPFNYFIFSALLTGAIVVIVLLNFNYVENIGYRQNDDGVLLSQSYRLMNGEVPHRDFISVRPVLPGVLHMLHFYIPLPLEINSRWFVIIEYYILSFTWIYLLLKIFNLRIWKRNRYLVYLVSAGLFTFILNISNEFYFPSTAIDATLFTVIGLVFLTKNFREVFLVKKAMFMAASVFCVSCAALCQQSFVIPAAALCGFILLKGIRSRHVTSYTLSVITGMLPVWAYIITMQHYGALGDFWHQVINRYELFQSGIVSFINGFRHSKLPYIHLFIILILTVQYFRTMRWPSGKHIPYKLSEFQKQVSAVVILLYSIITVFLSFVYISKSGNYLRLLSFELFWIFTVFAILVYFIVNLNAIQKITLVSGILTAWSGAASLHINAPYIAVGILSSGILVIGSFAVLNLFSARVVITSLSNRILPYTIILCLALFIFLFSYIKLTIPGNEYHNNRNDEITGFSDEFGQIKIDSLNDQFIKELNVIFTRFPGMKNNFVLLPDKALFYPMFNSRNPFPADDLLPHEYQRFRNEIVCMMEKRINSGSIYLIIDKYYADEIERNMNKAAFHVLQYFMQIQYRFVEIPVESRRLLIYKSI